MHDSWEPDSNARFLTLEEVKAAQAEAVQRERNSGGVESTPVFEEAKRPQKPTAHLQRRKKKTVGYRLKKFFGNIRFKLWNKKRSSASPTEFHYLTIEEIKRAKANQGNNEFENSSEVSDTVRSPGLQQDSRPLHKHKHRKKKRRFWKIFRFGKKKEQPIVIVPKGEAAEQEKEKLQLKVYLRSTINSTVIFMVAYQVSWLIYQLTVMVVASFSKIDSVLYYYEVMFPIGNYSPKWNQTNIIFITLSGPAISLVLWAVYRFVILRKFHPGGQLRLFLVWLYLNSIMLFFGAFVGGAITRQGFGYVVEWLYINIAFRIFLSLVFLSVIGWLTWKVVRFLPEYSGLDSFKHNRYAFVISRLVVPWLVGGGIMVLLKLSDSIPQHENIFNYDAFNIATLLFAVVPPIFNSNVKPHLIQGRKTYPKVHRATVVLWVLFAVFFVSLVRIGLSTGLYFQLIFDLNIGLYH
jgi:hypothetical protein